MSDGSEFQVCGAATENARRANSVRVLAADAAGLGLGLVLRLRSGLVSVIPIAVKLSVLPHMQYFGINQII